MKKVNAFSDWWLTDIVKRTSLYAVCSHEAKEIGLQARIAYLKLFVKLGYDLYEEVRQYLNDKDYYDISDDRLDRVICTFEHYISVIDPDIPVDPQETSLSALKQTIRQFTRLVENYDVDASLREGIEKWILLPKTDGLVEGWNIDLNKDLSHALELRNEREGVDGFWDYANLLKLFREGTLWECMFEVIRGYGFRIISDQAGIYAKKFFPKEDLPRYFFPKSLNLPQHKVTDLMQLAKDRTLEYAAHIAKVLWLGFPLFDDKVFFVRCNYKEPWNRCEIPRLASENKVSICIQENEPDDLQAYEALINEAEKPTTKIPSYVRRFAQLYDETKKDDVLVVVSYENQGIKMGLIKKGTPIEVETFEATADSPAFKLYCLTMKSAFCNPSLDHGRRTNMLDPSRFPWLLSIVPQQITISPVYKRRESIYGIYYGKISKPELQFLEESEMERLCTEWLRSEYAPEEYRLAYLLLRVGGNYPQVDILGDNREGKRVIAQVSYTYDADLVSKKIKKLADFETDFRVMFSMVHPPQPVVEGCLCVHLEQVWQDLWENPLYQRMLCRL